MSSVVLQKSGKFRAFAQVKQMRESELFEKKDAARLWADAIEKRMRAGKWSPPEKGVPKGLGRMTVKKAFEDYVLSESWFDKAQTTRTSETPKHKPVVAELGSIELQALTADDVRAYISKRRKVKPVRSKDPKATLSGAQIRLEVAALSAVLNWAISEKKLVENVTLNVKKPRSDRRTQRLTDEQIGKFFNCPEIAHDPKARAFFITLFITGCRPGELKYAEKKWLRDQPPQLVLPRTKNEDARTIVLTIHAHADIKEIADSTPADCKYLFATKKRFTEGWGPYNYRTAWDYGAEFAGLKGSGIVAYTARHEVISKLFESTEMSDGAIAGISGHRSSAALWNYKHLRAERQRPVMNALAMIVKDAMLREFDEMEGKETKILEPLKTGELLTDRTARRKERSKGKPGVTPEDFEKLQYEWAVRDAKEMLAKQAAEKAVKKAAEKHPPED